MQTFRNAYDFFDRFRAPRLIEASKSIESTSKNNFRAKKQNQRRVGGKLFEIVRAPKIAIRRFPYANIGKRYRKWGVRGVRLALQSR